MNAYLTQDSLEQQRWDKHQADMDKDDWITKEADRLAALYPDQLYQFANLHTLNPGLTSHVMNAKAVKEAYDNFVYELALQQATAQWSENYFIGVEAA